MQPGCFSIMLENLFLALLLFGVTNASFIVSKNVDTVSVKQCGLILLPTHHHLLQLLLRIVLQESVIKLRTIVLNSHHVLNRIDESNSLHGL